MANVNQVEQPEVPFLPDKVEPSMIDFDNDALVIQDDIEIIPGGDDSTEVDGEGHTESDGKHGFGYKFSMNEDGSLKYPELVLDKEMIRSGLSHIARTLDTFEFAYSRYDGRNKSLTNAQILEEYIHLRVIDLSGNSLTTFKYLAPVKHLLVLVVNENLMQSLEEIPHLSFLQALSAKRNKLTSGEGLFQNSLTYLQLSFNKISSMIPFDDVIFPNLTVLELRENNLETLEGLHIPTLMRLFVAKNQLKTLDGLATCINLTHLHARDNLISNLETFPHLEQLEYVNLRHNALKRFSQTRFLENSPNIRTLITMENPIATLEDYKMEMISANINLKRLDKQPVTEIDLVNGRELRSGREKGTIPAASDDEGLVTPPIQEDDSEEEAEEIPLENNNENYEDGDEDEEERPARTSGDYEVAVRKTTT